MSLREVSESFFAILGIRSPVLHLHAKQLLKFGITGLVNLTIDISFLALFVEVLVLPLRLAAPLTTIIVFLNVFLMNKYWTFRNSEKKHVSQGVKFLMVYGTSFVLVNVLTIFFAEMMGLFYIFSRLIAIALCALWNYLWLHFGVFGRKATHSPLR